MRIVRRLAPDVMKGSVLTIGTFDGFHLGHQALLGNVRANARFFKTESVVVIFEPHPVEFFAGEQAPQRVMNLRDKLAYLKKMQIDCVCILSFDEALSRCSAADFIRNLVKAFHIKQLVLGIDFCCGADRQGDVAYIKSQSSLWGYETIVVPMLEQEGHKVSSTLLRKYLAEGDFDAVSTALGRKFSLQGRVKHGDKIDTGFPTLNLDMPKPMALNGVFAVEVKGLGDSPVYGVANLGVRPTVGGLKRLLEVYCFNFNQDVYGQYVEVVFIQKIRDEMKFSSLDALKAQISYDVEQAKAIHQI